MSAQTIAHDEYSYVLRKNIILQRLSTNYTPLDTLGLEQQQKKLLNILERTLLQTKQNNAVLLLGYHGSGKSFVLRHVLNALKLKYNPKCKNFVTVYLNGLVQIDDNLAIREICRQLRIEIEEEEEKENDKKKKKKKPKKFIYRAGSDFSQDLNFLTDALKTCAKFTMPIFFIIDEFDKFALRPRQSLLYNLCNLLEANAAQMAIVGLSAHVSVYKLLEKRVKSRIFHRSVFFCQPKFEKLLQILHNKLCGEKNCNIYETNADEMNVEQWKVKFKGGIRIRKQPSTESESTGILSSEQVVWGKQLGNWVKHKDGWSMIKDEDTDEGEILLELQNKRQKKQLKSRKQNENDQTPGYQHHSQVNKLLVDMHLQKVLRHQYNLGRQTGWFLLITAITVSQASQLPTPADFIATIKEFVSDLSSQTINQCSAAEMCMISAMIHLEDAKQIPYNFCIVYEVYDRFVKKNQPPRTYPRKLCFKAFMHLIDLQLVSYVPRVLGGCGINGGLIRSGGYVSSNSSAPKEFGAVRLLIDPMVVRQHVRKQDVNKRGIIQEWILADNRRMKHLLSDISWGGDGP